MKYISVANANKTYSFKQCLKFGSDEGQIAPSSFPLFSDKLADLLDMSFAERVACVVAPFADGLSKDELTKAVFEAVCTVGGEPSVLKTDEGMFSLEMWQNASGYFSRLAIAIYFKIAALALKGDRLRAFVAAHAFECRALADAAFTSDDNIKIAAFYPASHASELSAAFASASGGHKGSVFAARGQLADIKSKLRLSVAKAVENDNDCEVIDPSPQNVVRILIDGAILFSAYLDLVSSDEIELGEKINLAVPAGDLELASAAIYAKNMGLPVKNIVIAANANKLVVECVADGVVDLNRDLYITSSPAFDVLAPDNLPRFIFELCGRDIDYVHDRFDELKRDGKTTLEIERDDVLSGWADEEDVKDTAFSLFDLEDWAVDPHAAAIASVYNDYSCETEDESPALMTSLVNPYLVSVASLAALGGREKDENKAVLKLEALTALDLDFAIFDLTRHRPEPKYIGLADIPKVVDETLK